MTKWKWARIIALLYLVSASAFAKEAKIDGSFKIDFISKNAIVTFFERDEEGGSVVDAFLLLPNLDKNSYSSIRLATIPHEGAPPVIETVFAEDVDKDGKSDLVVLVKWRISHPGIGTDGDYYKSYVFSGNASRLAFEVPRLVTIEEKIGSGLDGTKEGVRSVFKYKDAGSIRRLLRE
ncbi:hypothetical protein [Variovorax sp. dw_308]|uniref:hypothetical protein n=1 Tax=Variovorax sp. dw_308 TaxID=2721546 RepID=UPI001C462D5F|nr:hypothetical protein [Variovorax sp. dw_308]